MKAVKLIGALVGLLLVLIVGVAIYLYSNLNSIVKNVIETEGPKITQTAVTVGDVDIRPTEGRGELANFRIANPDGYDSKEAMRAETLVLQIKPASVMGDVKVIQEVVVQGLTVTAEQKGLTTNLQELLKSVQEAAGPEDPAAQEESDLRLMVEKLRFSDGTLKLITEDHGTYDLKLSGLDLNNLGTKEEGLTPAQLGKAIMEPALLQARRVAQNKLKDVMRDEAETRLKEKAKEKLGKDGEEKAKSLKDLINR